MKTFITICILLFAYSNLSAQRNFSYEYDDAGNRITRTLINPKKAIPQEDVLSDKKITVYPNPTTGVLRLELEGLETSDNTKIKIYDLQGAEVYFKEDFGNSLQIDLTNQVNGVYLLDIYIGDKRSYWKIIKEE